MLLALAEMFGIDITELSSGQNDRLLSALSEALSDPLFETYSPSLQELKLVTQNAPGLAHALITCHQAYRRNSEQLVSYDDRFGAAPSNETTSYDEVRDFFHFVDNYIHDIDILAESLAGQLKLGEGENYAALAGFLESRHGVRVVRGDAGEEAIRRFDPASRILTLSRYASAPTRDFQIAIQVAQLHARDTIEQVLKQAGFRTEEAVEVLPHRAAQLFRRCADPALSQLHQAARELRHDIELLAARFGASLEQVCHRLSTLQRPGLKGVPIFFARIDRAGNITSGTARRVSSSPVSARPAPCGTRIRPLRRRGGSSAAGRDAGRGALSLSSPCRSTRARSDFAPPSRAMPWRSAARSHTPINSSMPTISTSPTAAPPSTRSAYHAGFAKGSNAPAAPCRR